MEKIDLILNANMSQNLKVSYFSSTSSLMSSISHYITPVVVPITCICLRSTYCTNLKLICIRGFIHPWTQLLLSAAN